MRTQCVVNFVHLKRLFQDNKFEQILIHLHNSLDVVFSVCLGWFSLHIAGLSVGQSVPAHVDDGRLGSRFVLLAVGASTGAGPGALGALAGVERVLGGDVLAQHDHPVLQVTD